MFLGTEHNTQLSNTYLQHQDTFHASSRLESIAEICDGVDVKSFLVSKDHCILFSGRSCVDTAVIDLYSTAAGTPV